MRPPRRKSTQNIRGVYSEDTQIRTPDGGYPARLRGEGRLPIEVCLPRVKTRPAAQIAEEIVGPVGMARSDPGRAGARGWVRDAGVALSRAWHVPCEVPARMTCVT